MTRAAAVVVLVHLVLGGARIAAADPEDPEAPEARAHAAFVAAQARGDLDALEAVGRAPPVTRWTDDAWAAAARLAEQRADFPRARADLAQVVATTTDEIVRRRAQAALARLAATTGAAGQWDAVVAEHDRLAATILSGVGDPKPALAQLAALIAAHPDYPGATAARLVLAQGWERDGDLAQGIDVLDAAIAAAPTPETRGRARYAAFHARIHARDIDGARAQLAAIAETPGVDPVVLQQLGDSLATAALRAHLRLAVWIALGLAGVLAAWSARRDAGTWRGVLRALARPPTEVWYLAPTMAVLVLIAEGGNPMVARALRAIAVGGVVGAWLSGVALELARPVGARRLVAHVAVVTVVLAGVVFLVVDRDRMIDLIVETWRSGPALP